MVIFTTEKNLSREDKMPNYLVINGDKVVNYIVADSKEIAEEVTGLLCLPEPSTEEKPSVGWGYVEGKFINPNPPVELFFQ